MCQFDPSVEMTSNEAVNEPKLNDYNIPRILQLLAKPISYIYYYSRIEAFSS